MKIVHAADLHLDSPLRGLERYEGAPVDRIRDATRRALENLVDLCLDEQAELLLLAGDLFDGDWRDYRTGLFFHGQMTRLQAADIPVALVRGNHDAVSRITRQLRMPGNVFELPTEHPGTAAFSRIGVAVHGQSFATGAVTEDLAARYPSPRAGVLNIGLLHTSADGRPGHAPYAPTSLSVLLDRGYDYWALGHVHTREVLHDDPPVVFPGNLQGRHGRETGPKGATLLHVEGARVESIEHRALDVVRWERCCVDATDAAGPEEVVERARLALEAAVTAAEERLLAARVVLIGTTRADPALRADAARWTEELRAVGAELGEEAVWIERVELRTAPPIDLEAVARRDDAVGQIAAALRRARTDDAALAELGAALAELQGKLPRELAEGLEPIRLDDPAQLREALEDVERFLVPRLLGSARS